MSTADHLYFKITSASQKVDLTAKIRPKKLVLLQYNIRGIPVTGGIPYTGTFYLNFPDKFLGMRVKNTQITGIPLVLNDANTFVQFHSGFDLKALSGEVGTFTVELKDDSGSAAQFEEAHFWFSMQ